MKARSVECPTNGCLFNRFSKLSCGSFQILISTFAVSLTNVLFAQFHGLCGQKGSMQDVLNFDYFLEANLVLNSITFFLTCLLNSASELNRLNKNAGYTFQIVQYSILVSYINS